MAARGAPEPSAVVIFGASGDLTERKLFPALHNLKVEGYLPETTAIVGTSRTEMSEDAFKDKMRAAVNKHSRISPTDASWNELAGRVFYCPGDVTDDTMFERLKGRLEEIDSTCGTNGNRVWYMAMPPRFFRTIAEQIHKHGLSDTGGWQRVVIEKPFGEDLKSARELNATLLSLFNEAQVFRIDHYLGKETVQNLLVFRFANAIFEPIWNRRYVDHVQITVAESFGVEDRGPFYEQTGALRDVAQNHLLQLLALTAMEPPVVWDADAIRDEKVQVLRAVRRLTAATVAENVARGQYRGYRDEPGVDPQSRTETFAIDNWRWADVPFYLRTGKQLPATVTEIVIRFQRVPHLLFAHTAVEELDPNELIIRIQPDEGFDLRFGTKVPGPEVSVATVDMDFLYEMEFGSGTPEAYERLLLDCMLGDQTLFARSDEIEQAWEIVEPILKHWGSGGRPAVYDPGTWGPPAADELMRRAGRRWRDPRA